MRGVSMEVPAGAGRKLLPDSTKRTCYFDRFLIQYKEFDFCENEVYGNGSWF